MLFLATEIENKRLVFINDEIDKADDPNLVHKAEGREQYESSQIDRRLCR